jgi:oligopeptide/dipeptide ABC transporter ATP-binding protein
VTSDGPQPVLAVRDLAVTFQSDDGVVRALDGVSFELHRGRTLAVVGESGSGKSVMSLAIMGLLPRSTSTVTGTAFVDDTPLIGVDDRALEEVRGKKIAIIFQDPMTSLNPFLRIGIQLSEVLEVHEGVSRRAARRRCIELLDRVGIADASRRYDHYPHQFSGGMRQRVMIAMALLTQPQVLIADEATTALDVTIQAQILELLRGLALDFGTATLFITHDLGVVAGIADDVMVMYAGRVVERGPVHMIFAKPRHPYTMGLLASVPRVHQDRPLQAIPGRPPDGVHIPSGCAFHPRCAFVVDTCKTMVPPLAAFGQGQDVACIRAREIAPSQEPTRE